jgi:thiol-disulfide isomerase/thioredoxin
MMMKYFNFLLFLSVICPSMAQKYTGTVDGIKYYDKLDILNLPASIKTTSFVTGIPVEDLDTTYTDMIICGDTLIYFSYSSRQQLIAHNVHIRDKDYIYNGIDDYYFLTKLPDSPLDNIVEHDLQKIVDKNNQYNWKYSNKENRNIEYKLFIEPSLVSKEQRSFGIFLPIGNINKIHESFFNSITIYNYIEDKTLVCREYIPDFNKKVKETIVELEMNPYSRDTVRLKNAKIPVLSFFDTDSNMVTLNSVFSKINLIDFTASWCIPCMRENVYISKLIEELKNESLTVISISLDKSFKGYKKSISKGVHDGKKWVHLWDAAGFDSEFSKFFNLSAIPKFIIVNHDGKILDADSMRPSNVKLVSLLKNYLSK